MDLVDHLDVNKITTTTTININYGEGVGDFLDWLQNSLFCSPSSKGNTFCTIPFIIWLELQAPVLIKTH